MNSSTIYDCVIIGGGPAGLTAALYLARYRRNIVLYDTFNSRALNIPLSHNYPGFPEGISGANFLTRLRQQLSVYKVPVIKNTVTSVQKLKKETFIISTLDKSCKGKTIILATGVRDMELELGHLSQEVQKGLVRYCPICDGYEAINKKIAVIGNGTSALKEALFMRNYTPCITLFSLKKDWSNRELQQMNNSHITLISADILDIKCFNTDIWLYLSDETHAQFDFIYSAVGYCENNQLAKDLNATLKDGRLVVDADQQTSIRGVFAAGDIVSGLNQICVATSQAAIAATTIHNQLRKIY